MQGLSVDVIGVIVESTPPTNFITKAGEERQRRSIYLADENNVKIQATLWGKIAFNEADVGHIIAIKNAKVSDFGGKSLNLGDDGQIYLNPQTHRTKELQKWYISNNKGGEL